MWQDNGTEGSAVQRSLEQQTPQNESSEAREAMERRLAEKNKPKKRSIYRSLLSR
jgi:hypothetical protein